MVALLFGRRRFDWWLVGAVLLGTGTAFAQRVVPELPQTEHDYYGYAVTNLPAHYQSGDVQSKNNTPVDNPLTNAGATLGRVLFYDKQLSHDYTVGCASCHQQATGFGDTEVKSQGVNGETGRHSMALTNVGYYENGKAFWDERANSLEEQALMPIQDPIEMNLDLPTMVTRLENSPYYAELFQNAFGTSEVTPERVGKAIAQFERSMVSYNSAYDKVFENGFPNLGAMTDLQRDGYQVYHGGAGRCRSCHATEAQIGDEARNIGLDSLDTDEGAGDGKFKTPSLRNAEVRGRFMHDGRFGSLEEVIEFYSSGVNLDNPNVDDRMVNLNLTQYEKDALLEFLKMLTDWDFLTDEKFADPFRFACDFDADGDCGVDDVDSMLAIGPISGGVAVDSLTERYDMNADGVIDPDDLVEWLSEAALVDGLASPYKTGDANLDGVVNGEDFLVWNANKFTAGTAWSDGDFNGDGNIDGLDFIQWNANKFTSSLPVAVPEPSSGLFVLLGCLAIVRRRRRFATAWA